MSKYRQSLIWMNRCLLLTIVGCAALTCHYPQSPELRRENPQGQTEAALRPAVRADPAGQETLCRDFLKQNEKYPHLEKVLLLDRKRCFPFSSGFFALTIKSFRYFSRGFDVVDAYQIDWNIVWVKDGHIQVLEPTVSGVSSSGQRKTPNLRDEYEPGDDRYRIYIEAVRDIDGDGTAEIFLVEFIDAYEGLESSTPSIWTARGTRLVHYAHDPGTTELDVQPEALVKDVDGDGRPDIYTSGIYGQIMEPACGNIDVFPAVLPVFLRHGLPDGRFSATDATAQAALKKCCPRRPDLPALAAAALAKKDEAGCCRSASAIHDCSQVDEAAPYDLLNHFSHVIMCARAWGEPAEAVLQAIKPACFAAPDGCPNSDAPPKTECPDWVAKLATVKPELVLH